MYQQYHGLLSNKHKLREEKNLQMYVDINKTLRTQQPASPKHICFTRTLVNYCHLWIRKISVPLSKAIFS